MSTDSKPRIHEINANNTIYSPISFYWGSSSRYQKSSVELNTRYIAKQDKNLLYWNGELINTKQ